MKVEASGYRYDERISLYLIPETDVERVLLRSMWKHGRLELTNGVMDRSGQGFAIKQAKEESSDE
uniref:Uncharacterized protein n=1 Tax=viral metagenome TaxID=1070528 RepID=A0A6M3KUD4_9ZZZZ